MTSYCDFAPGVEFHHTYHETEYGFPTESDQALFELQSIELMQAGLSWDLILKKRSGMNAAFDNFDIETVARYNDKKIQQLLKDPRIIRNKLKVNAIIYNANRVIDLQKEFGSFKNWMDEHHPLSLKDWTKLFRKNFKFMGPLILEEFLMCTGYISGAHKRHCPLFEKVYALNPPWTRVNYKKFTDWPSL